MSEPTIPPVIEPALRALLRADASVETPHDLLRRVLAIPDSSGGSPSASGFPTLARRLTALTGALALLSLTIVVLALARVGPFEGPSVGSRPANPVAWSTRYVTLTGDDFGIEAGARRFTAANAQVLVHSDPGDATYRSLELGWLEGGVEMRLYLYFAADARDWWVTQIRTYDGLPNTTGSNWIYYEGPFFRTPLGQPYQGDVEIGSSSSDNGIAGHLTITGLTLRAFAAGASDAPSRPPVPQGSTPANCPSGATCVSLEASPAPDSSIAAIETPDIAMSLAPDELVLATAPPGNGPGDALLSGALEGSAAGGNACFWLTDSGPGGSGVRRALVWANGVRAYSNPLRIVLPTGVTIHVGDQLEMGGGAPPIDYVPSAAQDPCGLGELLGVGEVVSVNGTPLQSSP
jgi:hypothetical protein